MNNLYISIIIAAGITFLAIITKSKDETKIAYYALKMYAISFIITYVALTYLLTDNCVKQIIETGDADF